MQEEPVDGAVDPQQFQLFALEYAVVDVGAGRIGDELVALDPTGEVFAAQFRTEGPQVEGDQVLGPGIDGITEGRVRLPCAQELRFIVSGKQALGRPVVAGLIRREARFEEILGFGFVAGANKPGVGTNRQPIPGPVELPIGAELGFRRQGLDLFARPDERGEDLALVIGLPAGNILERPGGKVEGCAFRLGGSLERKRQLRTSHKARYKSRHGQQQKNVRPVFCLNQGCWSRQEPNSGHGT